MIKQFAYRCLQFCGAAIIACAGLIPATALAQSQEEIIAELQAQIAALTQRLDEMETKNAVPVRDYEMPKTATRSAAPSWTDRITMKGDFRYRHDYIDAEDSSNRNRQRIRARPEINARILDTVDVGFGLATGSDSPVSANQTLGNGASSKQINLNLAYVNWKTPLEGVDLVAGKFKNPLLRPGSNGLLWDSDVTPEGGAVKFSKGAFFGSGMLLWAEEDSGDDDSLVYAGQLGWRTDVRDVNLTLGAGYYHFDSEGKPVPYDGDPRGNSVDLAGEYIYDYQELELFAEARLNIADIPTKLFVDFVQNLDANSNDTGFAIGGEMKFRHNDHPWQLRYTYQNLEADAVFALWSDSNFIGGGTDGKGHIIRGSYSLTDAISLGSNLFINKRGGSTGPWEDYNQLQFDIAFKY